MERKNHGRRVAECVDLDVGAGVLTGLWESSESEKYLEPSDSV